MNTQADSAALDSDTVRELCGDISDQAVLEIVGSGASVADIEAALAWLVDGDAAGVGRPALSGPAAKVLDALEAESPAADEP